MAGLKPLEQTRNGEIIFGDIITAVDGNPIKSNNDLFLILEKYNAGDEVEITYIRDEKEKKISLVLGD